MDISPANVREIRFPTSKRGYDTAEVDAFVTQVADALEAAQNETTAMEARARAAVARLQERSQTTSGEAVESDQSRVITPDESETISRTLLLAQRTADATLADARSEADRVLASARDDAAGQLDAARAQTEEMLEEAKLDARRAGESERVQAESEVQSLLARRDFLESDVDHLEQFLVAQRERIAEVSAALTDIVDRVPGGLADMRRPLLSAAADEPAAVGEPEQADEGGDATPSSGTGVGVSDTAAVPDPGEQDVPGADDGPFPADPGDAQPTHDLPLTDR